MHLNPCGKVVFAAGLLLACTFPASAAMPVRWDSLEDIGNLGRVEAVEVSPFDKNVIIAGGDVLGVGVTTDAGANWQQTIGFRNNQDNDITFHPTDPKIIWVGTLGGPYKSSDGGKTWALKRNGMPPMGNVAITAPVQRVVFDPNNSQVLLAFAGNHRHMGYGRAGITHWGCVWKSVDGGENWKQLAVIDGGTEREADNHSTGVMINDAGFVAGSSSVLFACSDRFGVYKSTDAGQTWASSDNGLPNSEAWSIALHPTNPNVLWVALGGGAGVYKSTDGGQNWTPSFKGMTDNTRATAFRSIAVARSDPNYLYAAAWDGSGSTYRSTDGGASWTRIISRGEHNTIVGGSGNGAGLYFQRINVDPNDPKHVVGACEGCVVQSWDAGNTWKDLTSYAADGGWRGTGYSGMCGTDIEWNPYQAGQVFTIGDDEGKLERSNDYLWSWTLAGWKSQEKTLIGPYNGANSVSFAADGTIFIGSGQFGNHVRPYANEPIIKSTDFGRTWAYATRPGGAVGDNRSVFVNPRNSQQVWEIAGPSSGGKLYRSDNGGTAWRDLELSDTGSLWNIAAGAGDSTMYVGASHGIFQSHDGVHFSLMPGSPTSANFEYVYADPVQSGVVYALSFNGGGGGVFRCDGGHWTKILDKPQARAIAVDPGDPDRIAVASRGWTAFDTTRADGIWISEDRGATWAHCNDGLRMIDGPALSFNPNKSGQLIFATDGAGFFATNLGSSTPRNGTVPSVVGTIAAGDYDQGLQGFDHPDSARQDALRGLKAGQWAKYSVSVPATGNYAVTCKLASAAGARFHLEMNGVNVTGPTQVKPGPADASWTDVHIPSVHLNAGEQYLEFYTESGQLNARSIEMSQQ